MKVRRAAVLVLLGVSRAAVADETPAPPPAAHAPLVEPIVVAPVAPPPLDRGDGAAIAGALTAVVPLIAGGMLWSVDDDRAVQRLGTTIMLAGFAAAPWVSHGLHRRWKRAAVFGSISVATSAATLVAMEIKDPFYSEYRNRQRVPFGMLLTSAMFAAAAGVVDAFVVGPAPGARE
jgi:hypothetical protein